MNNTGINDSASVDGSDGPDGSVDPHDWRAILEKAVEEAQMKTAKLIYWLWENDRGDEAMKAVGNRKLFNRLMKEYEESCSRNVTI